jgi:multidrug transporter EmrE-like cation transporter
VATLLQLESLLVILIILTFFHSISEALYKYGGMILSREVKLTLIAENKQIIASLAIIIVSLAFSFIIKVLYGILLGANYISIIAGVYLGLTALFSAFIGRAFFAETLTKFQYIGFFLIAAGIIFLIT